MIFDEATQHYFDKKVKQVFVYLTSRCQLRCRQCLYKPLLCDKAADISFTTLISLLSDFRRYGAYKVSFLGGEPTLYEDNETHMGFGHVIQAVKSLGYRYVRVDTNGQFDNSFLDQSNISLLDEITFSLDGHNEETNDLVRGKGTFAKCVDNIEYAVKHNYNVQITSCVHKYSCPNVNDGIDMIESMIRFAEHMGVHSINFHPIIKVGIARDNWIDDTDIMPEVWVKVYSTLIKRVIEGNYRIKVRLPMRYCDKQDALQFRSQFFYCPLEMGERALIMPDGQIKVCAFTIGTNRCVARFDSEEVRFETKNNEVDRIGSLSNGILCYNQQSNSDMLTPLCMSYKPYQSEIVWEELNHG